MELWYYWSVRASLIIPASQFFTSCCHKKMCNKEVLYSRLNLKICETFQYLSYQHYNGFSGTRWIVWYRSWAARWPVTSTQQEGVIRTRAQNPWCQGWRNSWLRHKESWAQRGHCIISPRHHCRPSKRTVRDSGNSYTITDVGILHQEKSEFWIARNLWWLFLQLQILWWILGLHIHEDFWLVSAEEI